ncbi:MAG TPA: PqqD family protein [Gemmatimonadota bacterium]|nr:PqqD family protein [Gemmatimonadota bacterium]
MLLLHTSSGAYHRLNRTGAMIWHALAEPTPFADLERRILSEHEGARAMLPEDLAAYIADLVGRDLIHLDRESSGSAGASSPKS